MNCIAWARSRIRCLSRSGLLDTLCGAGSFCDFCLRTCYMKFLVHGMKHEQVDVKCVQFYLFFKFFCTSCEIKYTDDNRIKLTENTNRSVGSGVTIFSRLLQNVLVI